MKMYAISLVFRLGYGDLDHSMHLMLDEEGIGADGILEAVIRMQRKTLAVGCTLVSKLINEVPADEVVEPGSN
jgi:hypothetical protein